MWRTWGLVAVAACYSPSVPAGAPCQPDDTDCPASQTCQLVGGGYYCMTGAAAQTLDAPQSDDAPADAPAPPQIAFVQAAESKPNSVASSLTLPHAVAAGDAIIVCVNYPAGNDELLLGLNDTAGNVYQTVVGPVAGAGDTHFIAIAQDVAAATSDTITLTITTTVTGDADVFALEYSGIALASAFDTSSYATGSATAMDSGVSHTRAAPELILGTPKRPPPAPAAASRSARPRAATSSRIWSPRLPACTRRPRRPPPVPGRCSWRPSIAVRSSTMRAR